MQKSHCAFIKMVFFHPVCLFNTVHLLKLGDLPSWAFIPSHAFIRDSRVFYGRLDNLIPDGTSKSEPTWTIFPSSIIMSAFSILSSLTTVPPWIQIFLDDFFVYFQKAIYFKRYAALRLPWIQMGPDSWVKNGMAFWSWTFIWTQGSSSTSVFSSGEGGDHMISLIWELSEAVAVLF